MSTYIPPLANGIRTDHPVPGLPFVDDAHIPIDDPDAVEDIGRHAGTGTWGRCDDDQDTGEWAAFTTDPKNPSVGWVVRFHPEHGRSVLLYDDDGATTAYSAWFRDKPLLSRVGGYWWDGTTWYRPLQVFDWASERFVRREVHLPTVITAADLLDGTGRADRSRLATVMQLGGGPGRTELAAYQLRAGGAGPPVEQWRHDLALWASRRSGAALPLERCVATVNAPELFDAALLGVEEFAAKAELAASTVRAYIARDEADVPVPQAAEGPRKRWSAPVVDDWVEQRRRDPRKVAALLTASDDEDAEGGTSTLAPGLRLLWTQLSKVIVKELWREGPARRRWSRPHRNAQSAQNLSTHLGWLAAMQLQSTVPFDALAKVLQDAMLRELTSYKEDRGLVGLAPWSGEMLGWFVVHRPAQATRLLNSIVGSAERNLGVPREVTRQALEDAITMDGDVLGQPEQLKKFLENVFPPRQ